MNRWHVWHPACSLHYPLSGFPSCIGLQTFISHNTTWYKWNDKAKQSKVERGSCKAVAMTSCTAVSCSWSSCVVMFYSQRCMIKQSQRQTSHKIMHSLHNKENKLLIIQSRRHLLTTNIFWYLNYFVMYLLQPEWIYSLLCNMPLQYYLRLCHLMPSCQHYLWQFITSQNCGH